MDERGASVSGARGSGGCDEAGVTTRFGATTQVYDDAMPAKPALVRNEAWVEEAKISPCACLVALQALAKIYRRGRTTEERVLIARDKMAHSIR